MSKLSSYKSSPVSSNLLKAGNHTVTLIKAIETNSFTSFDGEVKDKLPAWFNPTEQFAVQVANGSGVLTHRMQLQGWLKYSDLTDKEVKSGKFTNEAGYACAKNKKGQLVRIEDEAKTAQCFRIFDRFMHAIGAPEGSGVDAVDEAIANKTQFNIVVVNDDYDGKDQLRISSFKRQEAVVEKSFEDLER